MATTGDVEAPENSHDGAVVLTIELDIKDPQKLWGQRDVLMRELATAIQMVEALSATAELNTSNPIWKVQYDLAVRRVDRFFEVVRTIDRVLDLAERKQSDTENRQVAEGQTRLSKSIERATWVMGLAAIVQALAAAATYFK